MVTTRTTVGGIARYECDRGHKLEGPPMIECLSNGEWSESATSLACTVVSEYHFNSNYLNIFRQVSASKGYH